MNEENNNRSKEGTFTAKIKDYGISETKAGDPQIFIGFEYMENDIQRNMTWFGSLKDGKGREITFGALRNCGFSGKSFYDLAEGSDSGLLDNNRELSIVIQPNEWEGKTTMRISFINIPGAVRSKLSKIDAIDKMKGMNLEGDWMQFKQDNADEGGGNKEEKPSFTEDDIPF